MCVEYIREEEFLQDLLQVFGALNSQVNTSIYSTQVKDLEDHGGIKADFFVDFWDENLPLKSMINHHH